ncbi:hypothetical protein [Nocardioides daeguensis]|uniref:Uncharacterized protein n=1 Tax=Nocardioides daeguensis TaxID=908359 RepID=A0ABP6UUM9_9ACTN|nr:hypothetical protein [Nocardioides daeguensis]MBV6728304.1 hypothetical protein [Nocardioides daeguensis]MCR1773113.1 hypothetical protein [Nocardioides daeguensis]
MIHLDPIGTIKRLSVAALKAPAAVAGAAVGVAQTAVRRVQGGKAAEPTLTISPDEPVNVTEELGLDPAPVSKPRPRTTPAPPPVTDIDAQADPDHVDVTPADIADAVKKD